MGAKVICFINYKGGVGKTTTAYHVSCSMAQHFDKRVLMIDIDPQTNLTFLCATIEGWSRRKRSVGTINDLYKRFTNRKTLDVKRFIWNGAVTVRRQSIPGLDLIPCDIDLLGEDLGGGQVLGVFPTLEALRRDSERYLRERSFLRHIVDEVQDDYDFVVIDCPPNLYLMTQNALHASDKYFVTAIPDRLSTIGLQILTQKVGKIGNDIAAAQTLSGRTGSRTVAVLGGIVFVKVRIGGSMVTNIHGATMANIRQKEDFAKGKCVRTSTTELIGYSEAAEGRVPVWEHDSENARRAARKNEYPEIAREVIDRS